MTKLDRLLTYAAEGSRESPPSMPVIFPMQCSCGHIFLEKYQYHKPLTDGRIGFCWCGFCRKKTFVTDSSRQSAIIGNGGDSGSDAKPPEYRFNNVTCSQCGGEFGPANNGFSHCINHKHLPRLG